MMLGKNLVAAFYAYMHALWDVRYMQRQLWSTADELLKEAKNAKYCFPDNLVYDLVITMLQFWYAQEHEHVDDQMKCQLKLLKNNMYQVCVADDVMQLAAKTHKCTTELNNCECLVCGWYPMSKVPHYEYKRMAGLCVMPVMTKCMRVPLGWKNPLEKDAELTQLKMDILRGMITSFMQQFDSLYMLDARKWAWLTPLLMSVLAESAHDKYGCKTNDTTSRFSYLRAVEMPDAPELPEMPPSEEMPRWSDDRKKWQEERRQWKTKWEPKIRQWARSHCYDVKAVSEDDGEDDLQGLFLE